MRILNLIRKIDLNKVKPLPKIVFKFVYVLINVVIGWNLTFLFVLSQTLKCQITFPSSTLSDTDQ